MFRWTKQGSRAADGRIVRLEAVRVGARRLTSNAAVRRYLDGLNATSAPPARPGDKPAKSPPAARQKRAARASAKLAAIGA